MVTGREDSPERGVEVESAAALVPKELNLYGQTECNSAGSSSQVQSSGYRKNCPLAYLHLGTIAVGASQSVPDEFSELHSELSSESEGSVDVWLLEWQSM